MVAIAARLVDAAPRLAQIWPGYWPAGQPFAIYLPGDGALLISTGERPDSYQPLQSSEAANSLKGRAFWHRGSLPEVQRPFVTDYPIGSGRTAILVKAAEADPDRIVATLLHEQFHVYQAKAFKGYAFDQFVDPLTIKDRVAFAAYAETERRILAKALGTEDPSGRRGLLQQYLALRREREAAMPAPVVGVERNLERVEGTAKYVDAAGQAAIAGGGARLKTLLVAELQRPLASKAGAFEMNWFRWRSYGTGAAITYFVSQLDKGDWRTRIKGGAMPDALLESLVQMPAPAEAAALARRAKESFAYGTILRDLEPVIRAGEKAKINSVAQFLAGAPYHLVLDATAEAEGNAGWASETMVQLGQQTIALPKASTFSYTAPAVSLAARNLPILMEGERYTVLSPSAPHIVGLDATAFGEHRLAALVVRGDGIDLKIDRPVVVTIAKTAMTIRLAGR